MKEEEKSILMRISKIIIESFQAEADAAKFDLQFTLVGQKKLLAFIKKIEDELDGIRRGVLNPKHKPYQKTGPRGPKKKYDYETNEYRYK